MRVCVCVCVRACVCLCVLYVTVYRPLTIGGKRPVRALAGVALFALHLDKQLLLQRQVVTDRVLPPFFIRLVEREMLFYILVNV